VLLHGYLDYRDGGHSAEVLVAVPPGTSPVNSHTRIRSLDNRGTGMIYRGAVTCRSALAAVPTSKRSRQASDTAPSSGLAVRRPIGTQAETLEHSGVVVRRAYGIQAPARRARADACLHSVKPVARAWRRPIRPHSRCAACCLWVHKLGPRLRSRRCARHRICAPHAHAHEIAHRHQASPRALRCGGTGESAGSTGRLGPPRPRRLRRPAGIPRRRRPRGGEVPP
jgi:hypothetical protein